MSNMVRTNNHALLRAAEASIFLALMVFAGLFLYCLLNRLPYPFELEWLEGEILCHALRLLHGEAIYAPPQTAFIPQVYPPLQYILLSPLLNIFGAQFWTARVISVMALLGILLLLFFIPAKEGGRKSIGLLSAGLFLSLYEVNGTWYDIGRNDMLFYLFMVAGCFSLAYSKSNIRAVALSVLCFFLGFYTKQSAPMFIAMAALYLFMHNKKQCFMFVGLLLPLLLCTVLIMNYWTDGWYLTYTIINPLRHTAKRPQFWSEIRQDLFYELPVFMVMLSALVLERLLSPRKKFPLTIWEYTTIPALLCYFVPRPLAGSERNELIPLTLWGCMWLGLFMSKISNARTRVPNHGTLLVVYILIILQLLLVAYNPKKLIPTSGSRERGEKFLALVQKIPGEVYIPYHAAYGILAGKHMYFNGGAFWCFSMTSSTKYHPAEVLEKITKKYFSAIILDGTGFYVHLKEKRPLDNTQTLFFLGDELSRSIWQHYEIAEAISFADSNEFRSLAGYLTRPERILRPKKGG